MKRTLLLVVVCFLSSIAVQAQRPTAGRLMGGPGVPTIDCNPGSASANTVADVYVRTDINPHVLYICSSAPNGWTLGGGSGLADPGSNGLIKRTALNTTAVAGASDLPAGIDAAKIADGTVTNAEFQRVDATSSIQTQLDSKAPIASPTFTGTVSGITKSMVGLGNVDNTSDATKNAASVTLTNKTIALGSNTVSGTTAQFNTALSDDNFATLGGVETFTGAKTFTDSKLILDGGDYGAADGSLPGTPVEKSFYLNTNASSRRLFLYHGAAFREVFLSGISGPMSVPNGGTGVATITGLVKGNGTSAMSAATAGTDYVSPSSTETLTNKTFNTESTGNVFTSVHKTWFAAAGCNNATAASFWDLPTSTPAVAACVTGTNTQKGVLQFADTSGGFSAQTSMLLPEDFTGTVDARIIWKTSATSGNAKFSLSTICTAVAATETDDPSFNAASTVTTAAPGTANRLQTSAISSLTITGCAAGEFLHLKLFRDGNDGSDTLSASLDVIGVEITTRRAQ